MKNFEKKIFSKKIFGVLGIPPKRKKVKNFEFQKSLGIILTVILSPHRGKLGENEGMA